MIDGTPNAISHNVRRVHRIIARPRENSSAHKDAAPRSARIQRATNVRGRIVCTNGGREKRGGADMQTGQGREGTIGRKREKWRGGEYTSVQIACMTCEHSNAARCTASGWPWRVVVFSDPAGTSRKGELARRLDGRERK